MFKTTSIMMACGLLGLSQAVKLADEGCCDTKGYIVYSEACMEPPRPDPIVIPDPKLVPEVIADIEMNLDVLLTHILHEEHPEIPDFPEPNTPEEREIITEVIEPVVIQLINEDLVPSIPTCTLPGQ